MLQLHIKTVRVSRFNVQWIKCASLQRSLKAVGILWRKAVYFCTFLIESTLYCLVVTSRHIQTFHKYLSLTSLNFNGSSCLYSAKVLLLIYRCSDSAVFLQSLDFWHLDWKHVSTVCDWWWTHAVLVRWELRFPSALRLFVLEE